MIIINSTTMSAVSISRVVEKALPALSGSSVTYNAQKNIFLTEGYTSAAGNTYFQGIRASDRIAIKYNIGIGYCHTFLNGIEVYGYDGHQTKLVGSRIFNCYFFNENNAKKEAIDIVMNYMKGQAKMLGALIDNDQLTDFSAKLVDGAYTQMKRLAY